MALQVEVVSPERILYSGEAEMVVCRTVGGGEIAFLTGHAPFLGALEMSVARVKGGPEGDQAFAVLGGFVEVRDNRVIVLSDDAEFPDQIDAGEARRQKEEAERRLQSDNDDEEAEAMLRRAETLLEVAEAQSR